MALVHRYRIISLKVILPASFIKKSKKKKKKKKKWSSCEYCFRVSANLVGFLYKIKIENL